jgi:hypothetical protein
VFRRLLTRFGYAALGTVYVALGVVALLIAIAGARDRAKGFAGTFRFLLSHPNGPTIVACIAVGLAAFVLAQLADAADDKRPLFGRFLAFASAVGHGGLAWMAVTLLLRLKRGPTTTHSVLVWLLSQPWGAAALEVTGIIVIAGGAFQLWQALSGRLRQQLVRRRLGSAASVAISVGRFGLAARGLVTAIIGFFLVRAAQTLDSRQFHEMGGVLEVLHTTRFGGLLLGLAGVGLVAYGAYLVLLGFFRRAK